MNGSQPRIQRFVTRFFELAGARIKSTASGLRVELTREQLALLEGRPLWGYRPPDDAGLTALYFAFDEDEAAADDRAELIGPGSFRLQQLCEAALRLGALGRVFIHRPSRGRPIFRPYIVFHFLVTYVGHDVRERAAPMLVDLVSGQAYACPSLSGEHLEATAGGHDVEAARLTVGQAHQRAVDALCDVIAREDASWFHDKWQWIENELDRLYAYLQKASDEHPSGDALASLREARLSELRELNRPRVEVRAPAATLLYAPVEYDLVSGDHDRSRL